MKEQLRELFAPLSSFLAIPKHVQLLEVGAGVVVVYCTWKAYSSYKTSQLRKKWAQAGKDVVVLHQFPRGKFAPNPSPFPLKLETYLRMAEIPYITDFKVPIGPKGKSPWITLNGEEISDSQICMEVLARKFNKDFSSHLTEEEKAISRALLIMTEEHLYWWGLLWRWVYTKGKALTDVMPKMPWIFRLMLPIFSRKYKNYAWGQGMGRHTEAEVTEIGIQDLKALSCYLGQKQFFMGDKPTELDCALFGLLAQGVWNMPGSPMEHLSNTEFYNLKLFCERMKEKFWPDWNDCLAH